MTTSCINERLQLTNKYKPVQLFSILHIKHYNTNSVWGTTAMLFQFTLHRLYSPAPFPFYDISSLFSRCNRKRRGRTFDKRLIFLVFSLYVLLRVDQYESVTTDR